MDELEQCTCGCPDYSVQTVYRGRLGTVVVIECHDCGRMIPLVVDDFTREEHQSEKCHQAWIGANKGLKQTIGGMQLLEGNAKSLSEYHNGILKRIAELEKENAELREQVRRLIGKSPDRVPSEVVNRDGGFW